MSTRGFGPSACLKPHRGILLLVLHCALSIPLGVSGPRGWSVWHSRTAFPARLSCIWTSRNMNNHKRGLRVYMPETDCRGAYPKSATYSAHVNFITINAILKREKRLLQRGKESMQKINGVITPDGAGR